MSESIDQSKLLFANHRLDVMLQDKIQKIAQDMDYALGMVLLARSRNAIRHPDSTHLPYRGIGQPDYILIIQTGRYKLGRSSSRYFVANKYLTATGLYSRRGIGRLLATSKPGLGARLSCIYCDRVSPTKG